MKKHSVLLFNSNWHCNFYSFFKHRNFSFCGFLVLLTFFSFPAFFVTGCSSRDLTGQWKASQTLESELASPQNKEIPVIILKVEQIIEYSFEGEGFKKNIVQKLKDFEVLDEKYKAVTKEDLEKNVNKDITVLGEYTASGNRIFFYCNQIADSQGNVFPYNEFALSEGSLPEAEYAESFSFKPESILIGGNEFFRSL